MRVMEETRAFLLKRSWEVSLAEIILKFLLVAAQVAQDAWEKKDPSKLRKVTDVFAPGAPFEAELTIAEARAKAIAEHKP